MSIDRVLFTLLLAFASAIGTPASAQTVHVQNGAAVQVQNGALLNLEDGQMNFGEAGATATLSEQSGGRVTGGTLTATRALSSPSSADPAGLGIEISTSADLGATTVTRGHAVQTASNGNESIERYYEISPSQNNSDLGASLTFTYSDAELNGLSESELELFKSEDGGSSWSEEGVDSRDAGANTVTLSGVESLSRWTLGSESAPLPVEMARFEGRVTEGGVRLTWQTASEENNAGFEVQRRAGESADWTNVDFVESKATGATTSEVQSYRFTDEDLPFAADRLEYRLRQVDVGGGSALTDPVEVERTVERLELKKTFPNPARTQATVQFAVPDRQKVTLQMYDMLGREVRTVAQTEVGGRQELQVNMSGLPSGTYFLRLRVGDQTRTQRLTVVQ